MAGPQSSASSSPWLTPWLASAEALGKLASLAPKLTLSGPCEKLLLFLNQPEKNPPTASCLRTCLFHWADSLPLLHIVYSFPPKKLEGFILLENSQAQPLLKNKSQCLPPWYKLTQIRNRRFSIL